MKSHCLQIFLGILQDGESVTLSNFPFNQIESFQLNPEGEKTKYSRNNARLLERAALNFR